MRGREMGAKKRSGLVIKRPKRKIILIRPAVLKDEPWYAGAAARLSIGSRDQRRRVGEAEVS